MSEYHPRSAIQGRLAALINGRRERYQSFFPPATMSFNNVEGSETLNPATGEGYTVPENLAIAKGLHELRIELGGPGQPIFEDPCGPTSA